MNQNTNDQTYSPNMSSTDPGALLDNKHQGVRKVAVLRIDKVLSGSQGESLGFKAGDIVASYDGQEISSNADLTDAMFRAKSQGATTVKIKIERDGIVQEYDVPPVSMGIVSVNDTKEIFVYNKLIGISGWLLIPAIIIVVETLSPIIMIFSPPFHVYGDDIPLYILFWLCVLVLQAVLLVSFFYA